MLRLGQYERVYEDVLAMPVLTGRKPEHDKFPGAHTTTTVEALMPDGKSVQGATSHYLGTSFGEAFDITYVDEDENEQVAHTTSWGISWRSLGALIMTHSDDQGLVLPPTLADPQAVVVPIWQEDNVDDVLAYAEDVTAQLEEAGIRVHLDDRDHRNPGFKYNEWELKGVPVRLEIGPNEVGDETVTFVHRPDGERTTESVDAIAETTDDHLETVYAKLYASAEETLEGEIREATSREEILGTIGQHGGYVRCGWCGDEACEEPIKDAIAAEIVMVPLDRDEEPVHEECAICGEPAEETAHFAKTY